jgi:hypothetical protein
MPQWRKVKSELLMTPRGLEWQCFCGERVGLVSEYAVDGCPVCGRAYRLELSCKEASLLPGVKRKTTENGLTG